MLGNQLKRSDSVISSVVFLVLSVVLVLVYTDIFVFHCRFSFASMDAGATTAGAYVILDSLEECISKLLVWKAGMESKGLRVNMKKTKFLISGVGLNVLQDSGEFPCAICRSGVGVNSIECSQCKLWVHKKCSGLTGRLVADPEFVCQRCRLSN